jgi:dUTP pyrophosphatase
MTTVKVNTLDTIRYPANETDSGYDIIAASDPFIQGISIDKTDDYLSIDYIEYDTNLTIEPNDGYHTCVFPRSSISKYNLTLANSIGLIDNGYRGVIKLRFKYNAQPLDFKVNENNKLSISLNKNKIYKKGDKIGQLVFAKTLNPTIEVVESFESTDRNSGGFGSTGQ